MGALVLREYGGTRGLALTFSSFPCRNFEWSHSERQKGWGMEGRGKAKCLDIQLLIHAHGREDPNVGSSKNFLRRLLVHRGGVG